MEKDNKLAIKIRDAIQKASPKPNFWSWESVRERMENFKKDKA